MCVLIIFKGKENITKPEYLRYEFNRYQFMLQRYLGSKYSNPHQVAHVQYRLMQIVQDVSLLKKIFYELYRHIDSHYAISHSLQEIYELPSPANWTNSGALHCMHAIWSIQPRDKNKTIQMYIF